MNMQYSESFTIPAGGWTGGANAIQAASTLAAGITADVRLWRDSSTAPLTRITMRPGEILPLKVRYVNHSSTVAGFN